jgi:RNA polymerase sigma factor (sigma-70 family)
MDKIPKHPDSEVSKHYSLETDSYTHALIGRRVQQLIKDFGFDPSDRDDLKQAFLCRLVSSLKKYDPAVGHIYPFVLAVVERAFLNIVRKNRAGKRLKRATESLNVPAESPHSPHTELIQTIGNHASDRRLGRERILDEEEIASLKIDMEQVVSGLSTSLQDFLERRKTQTLAEISRDLDVPPKTLRAWILQVRDRFKAAGLEKYFHE